LLFGGHAMPEPRLRIAVVGCCVAWAPPCYQPADGEIVNRFCLLLAWYCRLRHRNNYFRFVWVLRYVFLLPICYLFLWKGFDLVCF
jgi:hypothetical protein